MTLCGEMGMKRMSEYLKKISMVLVGVGSRGRGRKMNTDCHGNALFEWRVPSPLPEFHTTSDHSGSGNLH